MTLSILNWKVSIMAFHFMLIKEQALTALINFLQEASEAGYKMLSPILVNEDGALATGQLPDKEGQMYRTSDDDFI